MNENEISKIVFECGLKIHRTLGPGLLENVYEECMFYEIKQQGLHVEKQLMLPLVYENVHLDAGYRIDLKVDGKLIVEIKAVEKLNEVHTAQVLTYLRLSNCKLGLLINFNTTLFKDGVKRIINGTL